MEAIIAKIKKMANTGKPINSDEIINEIKNYKVVSFDIFDTLLKRNVENPTDVFDFVENRTKIKGFKKNRIEAEKKAREIAKEKEVTLEEIYYQLTTLTVEQNKLCMRTELLIETDVLVLNEAIYKVFCWCVEHDKTVFIASDMYLSEDFISSVLKKNGIAGNYRLYLSSVCKKLKSDGSMFDIILSENNLKPEDIIHIGDSIEGDYKQPLSKGIQAIHIPRYINKDIISYRFNDIQKEKFFNQFMSNLEPDNLDQYQKFGFECFGPFLWGYVNWIHRSLKEKGIKKVYFFSRDGLIMKKAFDICFSDSDIESFYLEVSRRSLRVPILWMDCSFDTVLNMISPSKLISLNMLFDGVGLNIDEYCEMISRNGLKKNVVFDRSTITENANLLSLFEQIKPDVILNSKKEYSLLQDYISQNEIDGRFAIVDIGWSGGMQRYLEQTLTKLDIQHEVYGFYTGVAAYFKRNAEVLPDINLNGYVFDFKNDENAKDKRNGFVGLFESLFLEQDGSVKNYYKTGSVVKASRYDYEYMNDGKPTYEYLKIKSIQQSAMRFVENAAKNEMIQAFEFTSDELFAGIYKVGAKPDHKSIKMFADFNFYDEGETRKLACPQSALHYVIHLKEFKNDFLKCRWKIGFLKRMLKIKLPYEKIYEMMLRFK